MRRFLVNFNSENETIRKYKNQSYEVLHLRNDHGASFAFDIFALLFYLF